MPKVILNSEQEKHIKTKFNEVFAMGKAFDTELQENVSNAKIVVFNGTGEIKIRYEYLDAGFVKEKQVTFMYEDASKFFDKYTKPREIKSIAIQETKPNVDIIYPKKSNISGLKELRDILFESLEGVKSGNITAEQSKCICSLSQTYINTIKVEIEHNRNKINGEIDVFTK